MFTSNSRWQGHNAVLKGILSMKSVIACLILAVFGLGIAVAVAQDQDPAFQCVQQRRCQSLDKVVASMRSRNYGQLIGNDLDQSQARYGIYVYRLTFLGHNGRVQRVDVDARTGTILSEYRSDR